MLANRILAREDVIDDFGHVSVRSPDDPERFFLACSRSPAIVSREDILEFTLDGEPINRTDRSLYTERALHGGIFLARPDVNAIVHHHASSVQPFGVLPELSLKPLIHMASVIGSEVPVWDSQAEFGDTNMLVDDMPKAHSVARTLGRNTCVLLRGHGAACVGSTLNQAVFVAVQMKENAALLLRTLPLGRPTYLTPGEVDRTAKILLGEVAQARSWEYRLARAGFRGI
jgi:HCOMODA/2-hydroxy-3-carboxy-muconic semialdehyde decarboxylase